MLDGSETAEAGCPGVMPIAPGRFVAVNAEGGDAGCVTAFAATGATSLACCAGALLFDTCADWSSWVCALRWPLSPWFGVFCELDCCPPACCCEDACC